MCIGYTAEVARLVSRRDWLRAMSMSLAGGVAVAGAMPSAPLDYDVCIVGSGFAGTYLGLRLVARGIKTAIVEAGPALTRDAGLDGATEIFPSGSEGDYAFPIDATRTIGVGGTSRKWNGVVTRLLPSDFRTRSLFGLFDDWPIAYDDLAGYYCEAEQAMHASGSAVVRGAEPDRACVYPTQAPAYTPPSPLFPARPLPFFPLPFALRGGMPLRLDAEEVPRFAASSSATLLTEHPATALIARGSDRIEALQVQRPDGTAVEIRARYFVIAAGVVETSRLLLASRSRWFPHGVGNARGLVGTGFNAHPRLRTTVQAPAGAHATYAGIHRTYALQDAGRRAGDEGILADVHLGMPRATVDVMLELEPAKMNRVVLADDGRRDRWGRPIALLHANWTPRDRRNETRALAFQRELAGVLAAPDAAAAPPELRWFHPSGTCRMAGRARDGVVDAHCRVFGVDNLYIAGASVFTVAGSGNPTLTIVALAMRLGDHLLTRLR